MGYTATLELKAATNGATEPGALREQPLPKIPAKDPPGGGRLPVGGRCGWLRAWETGRQKRDSSRDIYPFVGITWQTQQHGPKKKASVFHERFTKRDGAMSDESASCWFSLTAAGENRAETNRCCLSHEGSARSPAVASAGGDHLLDLPYGSRPLVPNEGETVTAISLLKLQPCEGAPWKGRLGAGLCLQSWG